MKRGFTLIEILIVIAILGVLIVTVLLLINPNKTISRAKDTVRAAAAAKVYDSYNASKVSDKVTLDTDYFELNLSSVEGQNVLTKIIGSGLDSSSNKNFDAIYLNYNNTSGDFKLCFLIESEDFKSAWKTQYDKRGNIASNCEQAQCYACLGKDLQVANAPPISQPKSKVPVADSSGAWYRADKTNNCNEYCAQMNKQCTDVQNACPSYCGYNSGYAQIEATWATWFNSPKDPINGETCWGNGPCSTSFKWKPLIWYNARCCCI